MKSSKEIKARIKQEEAEMNNLLVKYNDPRSSETDKDVCLRLRNKVYERVLALKWVLGINEC